MAVAAHRRTLKRLAVALIAAAFVLSAAVALAEESEIDHLVQELALKPGSSVADVGAGSGEISIALAERVRPNGQVYSTEINPNLLDKIRHLAQKAGARNVVVVTADAHETGLPANCCDAAFLREVYHHLTDPTGTDHSLFQAMRPGARLAIIDFDPSQLPGQPPPPGVPANRGGHGVPERIVENELTQAGFVLIKTMPWPISGTVKHYCVLFIKPGEKAERHPISLSPN